MRLALAALLPAALAASPAAAQRSVADIAGSWDCERVDREGGAEAWSRSYMTIGPDGRVEQNAFTRITGADGEMTMRYSGTSTLALEGSTMRWTLGDVAVTAVSFDGQDITAKAAPQLRAQLMEPVPDGTLLGATEGSLTYDSDGTVVGCTARE